MADASKLLRALLSRVYKVEDTEIDTLLSETTTDDAGVTDLLERDKTRVSEISKPVPGKTFQDGYKKAKSEVLTTFETDIKNKYGIDADVTGIDLVEAVVAENSKTIDPTKITDDVVKRHPVFQTLERDQKKLLKQKDDEWTAKYEAREKEYRQAETLGTVSSKALEILTGLNPVVSAKSEVASNIQQAFLGTLKNYEFDLQDGGKRIVILDKEGKVVTDGHGNSLEFDALVKGNAAQFYEFKANNGGNNAGNGKPGNESGNGNGQNTGNYPAGITKPTNFDELSAIVNNTSIPASDRQVVLQTWQTENPDS